MACTQRFSVIPKRNFNILDKDKKSETIPNRKKFGFFLFGGA